MLCTNRWDTVSRHDFTFCRQPETPSARSASTAREPQRTVGSDRWPMQVSSKSERPLPMATSHLSDCSSDRASTASARGPDDPRSYPGEPHGDGARRVPVQRLLETRRRRPGLVLRHRRDPRCSRLETLNATELDRSHCVVVLTSPTRPRWPANPGTARRNQSQLHRRTSPRRATAPCRAHLNHRVDCGGCEEHTQCDCHHSHHRRGEVSARDLSIGVIGCPRPALFWAWLSG